MICFEFISKHYLLCIEVVTWPFCMDILCQECPYKLFACLDVFFSLIHNQQPVAKATEEKAPKKPLSKATEKKGKTVEIAKEEPLDPVAEKLRQQR